MIQVFPSQDEGNVQNITFADRFDCGYKSLLLRLAYNPHKLFSDVFKWKT